jgi:hypothetical protein
MTEYRKKRNNNKMTRYIEFDTYTKNFFRELKNADTKLHQETNNLHQESNSLQRESNNMQKEMITLMHSATDFLDAWTENNKKNQELQVEIIRAAKSTLSVIDVCVPIMCVAMVIGTVVKIIDLRSRIKRFQTIQKNNNNNNYNDNNSIKYGNRNFYNQIIDNKETSDD